MANNATIKIAIKIFLLLFLVQSFACNSKSHEVVRVLDGDTIIVDFYGKNERVRFLNVNTPESVHPDKKQNIQMGMVASDYTTNRLIGKNVQLEFQGEQRDKYGRLLAYVIVDGENFCVELVKQGLSPYYTSYGLSLVYDREFRDAERYARENKLHIWGDAKLTEKYLRLKSKWGEREPPTI